LFLSLGGCFSSRNNNSASSKYHYKKGLEFLKTHKYDQAELEFKYTLEIENSFAPAHLGLAILNLKKQNLNNAEFFANKALNLRKDWSEAYFIMGKIKYNKNNYIGALDYFTETKHLIELKNQKNGKRILKELYYWIGVTYQKLGKMEGARQNIQFALKLDPNDPKSKKANDEIELFFSMTNDKLDMIKKIALKNAISRADWAILLVSEIAENSLNNNVFTESSIEQSISKENIPDLPDEDQTHKNVLIALRLGIISVYPDGTFKPERALRRAEVALTIQRIFKIYFVEIYKKNISDYYSMSPYTDLSHLHPIFGAVRLATSLNILKGFEDNTFRLDGTVSGMEALGIISQVNRNISGSLN